MPEPSDDKSPAARMGDEGAPAEAEQEAGQEAATEGARTKEPDAEGLAVLRRFVGTWEGAGGDTYRIEDGTWKCKRLDTQERSGILSLRWNAQRRIVTWGQAYFADPKDFSAGDQEITWYKLRDSKKRQQGFVWYRSEPEQGAARGQQAGEGGRGKAREEAVFTAKSQGQDKVWRKRAAAAKPPEAVPFDPNGVLNRRALLKFRHVAPRDGEGPVVEGLAGLGAATYEQLGLDAPQLTETPRARPRGKTKSDWEAEQQPAYPAADPTPVYSNAQADFVLAALMADPALAAAAAEAWPPYLPPLLPWHYWPYDEAWYGAGRGKGAALQGQAKVSPQDRSLFEIKKDDIERGLDLRTTVMVRNLSKNCTKAEFESMLETWGLQDRYTTLHVPSARSSKRPGGIAFVDFKSPKDILKLLQALEATAGEGAEAATASAPVASYARMQGQQQLASHFEGGVARAPGEWGAPPEGGASPPAGDKPAAKVPTTEDESTEDSETTKAAAQKAESAVLTTVGKTYTASTPDVRPTTEATPTSVARKSGTEAGGVLRGQVRQQVEYYFSPDNLCQDRYLRSLMDPQGWVKLVDLAQFPRLLRTGLDLVALAAALSSSKEVELSSDSLRVRSRDRKRREAYGPLPAGGAAREPAGDDTAGAPAAPAPAPAAEPTPAAAADRPQPTAKGKAGPKKAAQGKTLEDAAAIAKAAAAQHVAWLASTHPGQPFPYAPTPQPRAGKTLRTKGRS